MREVLSSALQRYVGRWSEDQRLTLCSRDVGFPTSTVPSFPSNSRQFYILFGSLACFFPALGVRLSRSPKIFNANGSNEANTCAARHIVPMFFGSAGVTRKAKSICEIRLIRAIRVKNDF